MFNVSFKPPSIPNPVAQIQQQVQAVVAPVTQAVKQVQSVPDQINNMVAQVETTIANEANKIMTQTGDANLTLDFADELVGQANSVIDWLDTAGKTVEEIGKEVDGYVKGASDALQKVKDMIATDGAQKAGVPVGVANAGNLAAKLRSLPYVKKLEGDAREVLQAIETEYGVKVLADDSDLVSGEHFLTQIKAANIPVVPAEMVQLSQNANGGYIDRSVIQMAVDENKVTKDYNKRMMMIAGAGIAIAVILFFLMRKKRKR